MVLDAGTGIFRLVEHLLREPKQSLTILLSHAHLDHVVGLTFLVDALAVTELEHVRLVGTQDKLDVVRQQLYHPLLFPVAPSNMEFVPLDGEAGIQQIDQTEVQWFPLEHPGGSIGFLISSGDKRLAYVTDTVARPTSDYVRRIQRPDLLLHECYFFSEEHRALAEKTGHSWLSAVTDVVRRTEARRTALIHVNPLAEILKTEMSLGADEQKLNMFVANDEMVIDF